MQRCSVLQGLTLETTSGYPPHVRLWLAVPEEIRDEDLLSVYSLLLSEDEEERRRRYRFERDRHCHLVTRVLLRTTLSRLRPDVSPRDWHFVTNAHGRPAVHPSFRVTFDFNVSHSAGAVVLAVARGAIGVDVETMARPAPLEVAESHFSASEVRALWALPAEEQHERFYRYWTLKEAYIKARGMGLALPLDQFSMEMERPPRVTFDPALDDDPARWRFGAYSIGATHALAIALDIGPGRLDVEATTIVPLGREEPLTLVEV